MIHGIFKWRLVGGDEPIMNFENQPLMGSDIVMTSSQRFLVAHFGGYKRVAPPEPGDVGMNDMWLLKCVVLSLIKVGVFVLV